MEKNYSPTEHSGVVDPSLSLPHFDEDATLLSARPVVPLHEVNAETRSRRRVIFGLTILVASLLGAITATLFLMRSEQNAQSAADTEVSLPIVSSSGAAGGSTSQSAEARGPEQTDESPAEEVPDTPSSSVKKRPTAAISRSSVRPARSGNPDFERAEEFETDERELRRAERRDARRDARRERRQRREQISDDLLRIREIFEGSPRP